jgi:hypothetical protein
MNFHSPGQELQVKGWQTDQHLVHLNVPAEIGKCYKSHEIFDALYNKRCDDGVKFLF